MDRLASWASRSASPLLWNIGPGGPGSSRSWPPVWCRNSDRAGFMRGARLREGGLSQVVFGEVNPATTHGVSEVTRLTGSPTASPWTLGRAGSNGYRGSNSAPA